MSKNDRTGEVRPENQRQAQKPHQQGWGQGVAKAVSWEPGRKVSLGKAGRQASQGTHSWLICSNGLFVTLLLKLCPHLHSPAPTKGGERVTALTDEGNQADGKKYIQKRWRKTCAIHTVTPCFHGDFLTQEPWVLISAVPWAPSETRGQSYPVRGPSVLSVKYSGPSMVLKVLPALSFYGPARSRGHTCGLIQRHD